MMANIKMIKSGDMEYLHGQQETYIKAITKQICGMDLAKCIGQMELITKVNGSVAYKMDKVISYIFRINIYSPLRF